MTDFFGFSGLLRVALFFYVEFEYEFVFAAPVVGLVVSFSQSSSPGLVSSRPVSSCLVLSMGMEVAQ